MESNEEVSYVDFVRELEKEYEYLQNGGTSYRIKTTELSLEVARKVGSVFPFYNIETSKDTVSKFYQNLDDDRITDVSKMLNIVANYLPLNTNISEECKKYLEEKRQHRNPLKLKK